MSGGRVFIEARERKDKALHMQHIWLTDIRGGGEEWRRGWGGGPDRGGREVVKNASAPPVNCSSQSGISCQLTSS